MNCDIQSRRASDRGFMCWLAMRASQFWDFIDKRDIEKHAMAWTIVVATIKLGLWTLTFATTSAKTGTDIAAIIAAIWLPWSGVQAIVVKWYFDAR